MTRISLFSLRRKGADFDFPGADFSEVESCLEGRVQTLKGGMQTLTSTVQTLLFATKREGTVRPAHPV